MITLCRRAQNVNNEAFLWKTAVLGREKPTVGAGISCPWPILVFYIPPCRKTFTAWRNVKCQHGRATKCSRTNRGLYHSQNCNFPEERFILISFCHSVRTTPFSLLSRKEYFDCPQRDSHAVHYIY
jgi:hypothetical protein